MEYSKLIAITGMGGLFELVASKKDGAIVKSLEDKTTKFVSSRVHNFSHLESIEVYTAQSNVNLADIFIAMKASKEALPDDKDANAVKKYFEKVYPELDFERVYNSDMKKMVKWLKMLDANEVEVKLSEPAEEEDGEESGGTEAPAAEATEEAPADKPAKAAKTARAPKADKAEPAPGDKPDAEEAPGGEEKPKKRAPRKKKEE